MTHFLLILEVDQNGKPLGALNVQEVATDFLPRMGDNIWLTDGHPARDYLALSPSHPGATVVKVSHWVNEPDTDDKSSSCMVNARVNIEEIPQSDVARLRSDLHWVDAN